MSCRFYCGARAAAGVNLICGLLITALSSAHLIAVSMRRIELKTPAWVSGEPHAMIAGVPYDFRMYSLLLFGALVLAGWVAAIRATAGIARGDLEAGRSASRGMLAVLATVIPVMPLQAMAPALLGPAAIALAAIAISRSQLTREQLERSPVIGTAIRFAGL